jgi:hypothetical protein
MKTLTILSAISASVVSSSVYVMSFMAHPNFQKLQVVPEWNGPDFKIHYTCKSSFVEQKDINMVRKGDHIVVNYGALGRRRQESFKCNAPVNTVSGSIR